MYKTYKNVWLYKDIQIKIQNEHVGKLFKGKQGSGVVRTAMS